jgi:hypothetical protein
VDQKGAGLDGRRALSAVDREGDWAFHGPELLRSDESAPEDAATTQAGVMRLTSKLRLLLAFESVKVHF